MAKLDDGVKTFIVRGLACYDTPSQVAAAVKEEFGLTLTRMQVALYDPATHAGRDLSKKWRAIFAETRKQFLESIARIPIAHQTYRLRQLHRMFERAAATGNAQLAAQLLEQAAKEVGGAFTNTRKHEGGDPANPIHMAHRKAADFTDDDLAAIAASGSA